MKSPTLSPKVGICAIVASVALAGTVEMTALQAKERHDLAPHKIDRAYCTQCHSDARAVMMMQLKEGSCTFLYSTAEKRDVAQRLRAYTRTHSRSADAKIYAVTQANTVALNRWK